MSKTVCLVSPEAMALCPSSSIVSDTYIMAKTLIEVFGCQVSIVQTTSGGDRVTIEKTFSKIGAELFFLDDFPQIRGAMQNFFRKTHAVDWFLQENDFDLVIFTDREASGFIPVQRKRTGYGYENTILAVTLRGSTEWQMYCYKSLPVPLTEVPKMNWAERYYRSTCRRRHILNTVHGRLVNSAWLAILQRSPDRPRSHGCPGSNTVHRS